MSGVSILKSLFDEKKIRVLQVFIDKPHERFTLKEIVKKSKVPLATVHRILKALSELKIITKEQQKHLSLFMLARNEDTHFLQDLLYERPEPIQAFITAIQTIPDVQQAIMHGDATETRANVVLIGLGINKEAVNAVIADIREKHGFTFSHLILEPEQFAMLEKMGQFSGGKTLLFSK